MSLNIFSFILLFEFELCFKFQIKKKRKTCNEVNYFIILISIFFLNSKFLYHNNTDSRETDQG